ncbi:LysR substrate-binding domain-containing protein [Planktotalea sp.]|uniref:LysR family transcriptional regulator n=1 Tax=Planktotalea sp. TaxID=2029877 RepID=UPI00329983C1
MIDTELLSDMAIFAAVVDHDGFSKAADALNMSKSSVSRRIAALEKRLAIKLMTRTTRSTKLTESGRLYYDYCAQLVSNAEEADAAVKLMQSVPSGTLNLSLPETLGRASILPLLPIFLRQHPDIRLNLTITSRKVDLAEERIDVAVRKGTIEDDSLMAVPLGSSTQLLYATPDFLKEIDSLSTPRDLAKHAYLTSQISAGPLMLQLWRGLEEIKVKVEPRLAVKDHEALLKMTLAGLGIALLPVWMAKKYEKTGELQRVLPAYTGPSVDFNIVYQPYRGFSPAVRAFVEFLPKHLADVEPSI